MKTKRQKAQDLGQRLQRLARDYYLGLGYKVHVAAKKVVWVPAAPGDNWKNLAPRSFTHDIFGCWDLAVARRGRRFFVQVTTLAHVSNKRAKITAVGFPASKHDVILGWEKGRKFRVLRGPSFTLTDDVIVVPRPPKKPSLSEQWREFAEVASYG